MPPQSVRPRERLPSQAARPLVARSRRSESPTRTPHDLPRCRTPCCLTALHTLATVFLASVPRLASAPRPASSTGEPLARPHQHPPSRPLRSHRSPLSRTSTPAPALIWLTMIVIYHPHTLLPCWILHQLFFFFGNGALLPVRCTGSYYFPIPNRPLFLNNVLVVSSIIKNLIFVRHFTTDNNCSIEIDPFGLSVKDFQTRSVIARCNSMGNLYSFFPPTSTPALAAASVSTTLWHRRLGRLGLEALSKLISSQAISYTKPKNDHVCHVCQLGRHVRLRFLTI
jgi:hypothetical protein